MKKIIFSDIEIKLTHEGKTVDLYSNTLIAGNSISCTKEELNSRLESCVAILEGATEFYCLGGKWIKIKSKKRGSR